MKLGTENKKKVAAALTLLVGGAWLLYRGVAAPAVVAPPGKVVSAEHLAEPAPKPRPQNDARGYIPVLLKPKPDPDLRLDLLVGSEGLKYEGTGRDIFSEEDDIPKPVAPALLVKSPPLSPLPPPPPPLDLKFWGWVSRPSEPKAIFLSQGEDGFIAQEGDVIARRYKVLKINSTSVEIEDVLTNIRQNLAVSF